MDRTYKALVVRESDGKFVHAIEEVPFDFLPEGEILIKVSFAGLNYKDALSANGHKGVSRNFPHTPGVDAAGVVEASTFPGISGGMKVLVTSYDLGMNTKGGFADYIRVPPEWVIPLPHGLNLEESMILGTAGYTAALALYKMELNGQEPGMGEIVVTGASGGVGSMAVAILKQAGYKVIASSGKSEHYTWLHEMGAKRCVNREDIIDHTGKPLISPRWAGAIDTVGGDTLANLLKGCNRNGNVATCGLVGSPNLSTTVYPFILNGVNLLGIDSAETPYALRRKIWDRIAKEWKPNHLRKLGTLVSLEEIPKYMEDILSGETVGRIVADMSY